MLPYMLTLYVTYMLRLHITILLTIKIFVSDGPNHQSVRGKSPSPL